MVRLARRERERRIRGGRRESGARTDCRERARVRRAAEGGFAVVRWVVVVVRWVVVVEVAGGGRVPMQV